MKSNPKLKPFFRFTIGYSIFYLSVIVLIPVSAIFIKLSGMKIPDFLNTVTNDRALAAFRLTFLASLVASVINGFFGLVLAWILVRYNFLGKRILDALIDFPFALPTAVAGLTFGSLYSEAGWIGKYFAKTGLKISYTPIAVVLVLVFVGMPFIVRSVQPVLEDMDTELEEAARSLGANKWQTFRYVIFPHILPAWLTGFTLAFARALGEYGSVVFVSGNIPFKTEIIPLLIIIKLEEFNYQGASAIAAVMLLFSFSILIFLNLLERWGKKYA